MIQIKKKQHLTQKERGWMHIGATIPPSLHERLSFAAMREGKSLSQVIREKLEKGIK